MDNRDLAYWQEIGLISVQFFEEQVSLLGNAIQHSSDFEIWFYCKYVICESYLVNKIKVDEPNRQRDNTKPVR